MEGDEVGLGQQLVQLHLAHAMPSVLGGDIGIVGHDLLEAEAADLADQRARDAACADDANLSCFILSFLSIR